MKIIIAAVGKIKEKYFTMAVNEYVKRLGSYAKIDIIEVADEKTPDGASKAEEEKIKKREAERLLKNIKEDAYVITLEIGGKMLDSIELSEKIESIGVAGYGTVVFVIGGSLGLHQSVSERANFKLSFSKMTFPHQLMRVILLEQVYRSFRILNHAPYHK